MATRHGPKAPKTDAPEHVRAAKMELRALGAAEREVRKRWYAARAAAMHDMPYTGDDVWGDREKLGDITYALWAAEHARLAAAATRRRSRPVGRPRACLRRRCRRHTLPRCPTIDQPPQQPARCWPSSRRPPASTADRAAARPTSHAPSRTSRTARPSPPCGRPSFCDSH